MTPRNSPSGLSAWRICSSAPGRSLTQCRLSRLRTRSKLSGAKGRASSSATTTDRAMAPPRPRGALGHDEGGIAADQPLDAAAPRQDLGQQPAAAAEIEGQGESGAGYRAAGRPAARPLRAGGSHGRRAPARRAVPPPAQQGAGRTASCHRSCRQYAPGRAKVNGRPVRPRPGLRAPALGLNSAMISASLRRATGRLLDLVLPPRCVGCGQGLVGGAEAGRSAPAAGRPSPSWRRPTAGAAAIPSRSSSGPTTLCAACRRRRRSSTAPARRSATTPAAAALLLSFKHADRTDLAPAFGRWLARAGAELLAEADLVAPVPLHWTRLFARRYNQAALLAQAAARQAGRALPARPAASAAARRPRNRPAGPPGPAMSPAPSGAAGAPAPGRGPAGAAGGRCPDDRRDAGRLRPGPQGGRGRGRSMS